jgi:signal transduction histidine kinase/CheY-like chemotaxis protein
MPATPHAPLPPPDGSGPARQTSPVRQGELDVFYDIARLLESADDSETRVERVLSQLGKLVPHERCAVLETIRGSEPRLIGALETPASARARLEVKMLGLLKGGAFDGPRPPASSFDAMHLAVPLIVFDKVVGVLLVERAAGAYEERDARTLSVVAAKLAGYFSMLHALTREQQRIVELSEARRAVEAADRAKDEFLALVSHELRTPLNSILTWTDALRSGETSEHDRTRAVEAIERAVRLHAKSVADLLDLSCLAAAALRLDLRTVQPADLIKQAIAALEPQAKQKAIKLDIVLDESVSPLVVDPRRLSQVVVNLVTNAIEFTPPGGHVEVRLEQDEALARIRVMDTGAGIRPELLGRLFEPFAQVDSSTTRAHGGLGLGLALVKDLVELHGGQVRAESAGERKGAIFTVELPLGGAVRGDLGPPIGPPRSSRTRPALAGIRVLLVDDDKDIGEVLQLVLEAQGAIVSVVHSAVEALASLTLSMPNVLLSDLSMPGGSGYDLMRSIVAREGKNAPPAAAISACAPGQSLRRALDSGFRMLLEKPIDHPRLIAAVATLAGEARHDPSGDGASKVGFVG